MYNRIIYFAIPSQFDVYIIQKNYFVDICQQPFLLCFHQFPDLVCDLSYLTNLNIYPIKYTQLVFYVSIIYIVQFVSSLHILSLYIADISD